MYLTTHNIITNKRFDINWIADLSLVYSIKITDTNYDINDIDKLEIKIGGSIIWSIDFKSMFMFDLLKFNKNEIIFPRELFFINDDYIYTCLLGLHCVSVVLVSKKNINCELKLLNKYIENKRIREHTQQIQTYEYDEYKYTMNWFHNLYYPKNIMLKSCKFYKINLTVDDNNYDYTVKRKLLLNDNNIQIINLIKSMKIINDIKNVILDYCDIYEYIYNISFNIMTNKPVFVSMKFNKGFDGNIIVIKNDILINKYGMAGRMYVS